MPRHPNARRIKETPNRKTRAEPVQRSEVGVVFVHGIGNQQPGSLLEKWGQPCVDALATLAESQRFKVRRARRTPTGVRNEPMSMTLCLDKAGRTREILLTEAIWSDAFRRPPWWRCLIWVLRSLPASLLLFAPDRRDAALLEDDGPLSFRTEMRRRLADYLPGRMVGATERVALRLMYRVFTGVLLVGFIVVAIAKFPPLALLLAVVVVAYLASADNVVGHVVVAASDPSELHRIQARVRACIEWTLDRCDQVVVVAHSQGGFICHSILDTEADPAPPKRVRGLIGVGSGLKPIWLLQQLNRPRIAVAVWIATLAAVIGEASVVALFSGADPTLTATARGMIDFGALAALPVGALLAMSVEEMAALSELHPLPLIPLPDSLRHPGVLPVLGLALFFGGCLIAKRVWRGVRADKPARSLGPIRANRWLELSSYHDPVGRLLYPLLPSPATEKAVAVGGHPIRDHLVYFDRSSVLPWIVAGEVFKTLRIRPQLPIAVTTAALQLSAERRRVLRYGLFLVLLLGGTFPAVAGGQPLLAAITNLALVLLVASFVFSLASLAIESRANRRALTALQTAIRSGMPFQPPRLPVPAAKRHVPAYVAFLLAVLTFCVMFPLLDYPPGQSSAGAFMLLTLLFAAYGVAIAAGYRPWRWLMVLLTYLTAAQYLDRVPPWTHTSSIPEFYAVPAVPAIFIVACGVCWLVVLLRPKRINDAAASPLEFKPT